MSSMTEVSGLSQGSRNKSSTPGRVRSLPTHSFRLWWIYFRRGARIVFPPSRRSSQRGAPHGGLVGVGLCVHVSNSGGAEVMVPAYGYKA